VKFFIDSADIAAIREVKAMGMCDGVTTNPSLMAKEGRTDTDALLKEICTLVQGPVSGEVTALEAAGMIAEGKRIAKIDDHMVVKVPTTYEGLKAMAALAAEGISVNATLVFSVNQALLVAKTGADYVSPFVGRLDDVGEDGMALIGDIVEVYDNYDYETEIIVASVRHPMHVVDSALLGAHIATIPPAVIPKLVAHPLTDKGLAAFMADWAKLQGGKG
jgi:transaldolase